MSGTPVSEYPEITRDMLELRSDLNSAYAEIASLRAQLDEARAKLKRKKEASAQIEKTATEAWHLIAALPYSSAAGELEEKLRALLSESKS